nr:PBP1A family penicillin-binding protein [Pseudomonadota bacterium]
MRLISNIIKIFFFLAVLCFVGIFASSFWIKEKVYSIISNRNLATNSAVYSSPFPIAKGVNINNIKLRERLERLNYHLTSSTPENPGEVFWGNDNIIIYFRGLINSDPVLREPILAALHLDNNKEIEAITELKFQQKLRQVILEPELLSNLGGEEIRSGETKQLSLFPNKLINALLAIEDERFYSHFGIDPIGLARAIYTNYQKGHLAQGGSTLTQQLAKNLFFSSERSITRKVLEAAAALSLEMAFSKDEIMELYLNEVFLGQVGNYAIHGFSEASKSFFNKNVKEISLLEAASLAGMIKAPTKYNPRKYPKRLKTRAKIVLDKMLEQKFITQAEYDKATTEDLKISPAGHTKRVAPYFVDYIKRILPDIIETSDFSSAKFSVITGIDVEYQKCADYAVETGLNRLYKAFPRYKKAKNPLQSAIVALNPINGQILAWVGGRDYSENQFDRVSQAKRQPGSAFKPFVYLTALDKNLNDYKVANATNTLMDEPVSMPLPNGQVWEPKNFENEFRGEVTIREALTHSLNIPTIELAMKVGIGKIAKTAELYGFGKDLPLVPSLALGAGEVSPLEISKAYAALANGGILIDLQPITYILKDDDSKEIYKAEINAKRASSEPAVFVLTSIMQDVINYGTGNSVRRMGFTAPAAGKTGTSNDTRDAWFCAFTPRTLAVVWVGFDNNDETNLTGGHAAAPIWTDFMKC